MDMERDNKESKKTDTPENYTCPYCRFTPNTRPAHIREEEEVLDSRYCGSDLERDYYLEKKRKYDVYICDKCHGFLKMRTKILECLSGLAILGGGVAVLGVLVGFVYSSEQVENITFYTFAFALICFCLAGIFLVLWKIAGPSRAHVKYERALTCNAVFPRKSQINPELDKLAEDISRSLKK